MYKTVALALLFLLHIGCKTNRVQNQQKDKEVKHELVAQPSEANVSEKTRAENELFKNEVTFDIPYSFFSVKLIHVASRTKKLNNKNIYREDCFLAYHKCTTWERTYVIGKDSNGKIDAGSQELHEYRFYNFDDMFQYLILLCEEKACYIRWRNESKKNELWCNDDIGENTIYLETNMTEEIITSRYKNIKCPIIIKHPKGMKIPLYDRKNYWKEKNYDKKKILYPVLEY